MSRCLQVVLGVMLLSPFAFAQVINQGVLDAYQVRYAANLAAGDSFVNLTNAGDVPVEEWSAVVNADPVGDMCANVYVFAEDQQLIACCSCPLTPNHLRTLSVNNDLISNTLTPGVPIGVTVALLAVADQGACDAANVTAAQLAPGLRAWGTTIHALPGGGYGVSETAFSPAELSASELSKLTAYCGFIEANGSGYGICKSCANGAAGAARQ